MYFKDRIAAGETLLGAGIFCPNAEMIDWCAHGMDWIWLEGQHTHADWMTLAHCVRTAHAIGVPTLVRTWTHDPGTIERLLDTGAEGIIVPLVDTPEQAEHIVTRCFYPPVGKRSFGSLQTERIEPSTDEWNKRIVTMVQIETPEAVENAEAIANVPGVDVLNIGTRDLALRQNIKWEEKSQYAALGDQVKHVVAVSKKAGKAACALAQKPESLADAVREGYQLICAGMDADHLFDAYQGMRRTLDEIEKAHVQPEKL
jgi:2-keto-3-deoxy-L-rhamnonate aldolase RhmA